MLQSVMRALLQLTGFAILVSGSAAYAGDAEAGKAKAATCAACHGPEGISMMDQWPNLAGQRKGYLITAIKAYRDGIRNDMMMGPMAKPLTDEDIENLATYYSELK